MVFSPKYISKIELRKIRNTHPKAQFLKLKEFGKSQHIEDYSDTEISEMVYGIYKQAKALLVDGDYFLNLNDVIGAKCVLKEVSYYKKPTIEDYKTNKQDKIDNIRSFYVESYSLITNTDSTKRKEHNITGFLNRIGFLNFGKGRNINLLTVPNNYKTLMGFTPEDVKFPKDLFSPIRLCINDLFFDDQYKIIDFKVESNLVIIS